MSSSKHSTYESWFGVEMKEIQSRDKVKQPPQLVLIQAWWCNNSKWSITLWIAKIRTFCMKRAADIKTVSISALSLMVITFWHLFGRKSHVMIPVVHLWLKYPLILENNFSKPLTYRISNHYWLAFPFFKAFSFAAMLSPSRGFKYHNSFSSCINSQIYTSLNTKSFLQPEFSLAKHHHWMWWQHWYDNKYTSS